MSQTEEGGYEKDTRSRNVTAEKITRSL